VICPSCGTPNRDDALFCKYCGLDLSRVPRPAPPAPTPAPTPEAPPPAPPIAPPPRPYVGPLRPSRPRVWWHPLGVFAILAAFFLFVDYAGEGRVSWSLVVVLAIAFIIGGVAILQYLASPDRRDRRPFLAGAALLIAAVLLLPAAVALQSSPTTTDVFTEPVRPGIDTLALNVVDESGHVTVAFTATSAFLVRAEVTHLGGLFSSHYPGDVVVTNRSSDGVLEFNVTAKGVSGLFFFGGHDIVVTVNRAVAVQMVIASTTGSVQIDVPQGVLIRPTGILASVTTGNVAVSADEAHFEAGSTVRAQSTTGSVTIRITQTVAYAGTVVVQGQSTTGGVTFTFARAGPEIAAKVTSTVTTGSITYDPSKYSGPSNALLYAPSPSAYDGAAMKFDVTLQSTTGSISIG